MQKLGDYIKEYSVRNKHNEDIPVYSVTNSNGFCRDYFGKEVASSNKKTYKIVPRNAFAYNPSRINVGSVDYQHCEDKVIVSPLYNVFTVDERIDPRYLYYYLKSPSTIERIKATSSGSVRANLKFSTLCDFPFELPPLSMQKKIIKILDNAQLLISSKNDELKMLDALVEARFVEMFGAKNNGRFSTLGNECAFYSGTGFPNKYQGNKQGDYPFYKVGDISKNIQSGNKYLLGADNYIDDDTRKAIRGSLIPEGVVVFAKIGEALRLNRRAITSSMCLVDNNAMGIKPMADDLLIDYFFEYMKNLDMQKLCAATTVPSVRKSTLEAEEIYVPDIKQQEQFSSFVARVDKTKIAVRKSIEEARVLLDALMQDYFD